MKVRKGSPRLTESCFLSLAVKFYNSLPTEHHKAKHTDDLRDLLGKYF